MIINKTYQRITSARTSINSQKVPAIFHLVNFGKHEMNLDYGGGKYDTATKYLSKKGITNLIYDPYNRTEAHNSQVVSILGKNGGAETATCSNVLNVIAEEEARYIVLTNIREMLMDGGTAYFTVYEGNRSGIGAATSNGYQLNRKTADYMPEILQVFPNATRKGKLITATKE